MKVGDYVRTKDGNIFQITGSDIEFASEIGSNGNLPFNAKIISSEIIDLIEVGDYVNGIRVHEIEREEDGTTIKIGNLTQFIIKDKEDLKHTGGIDGNNDRVFPVKSIVTKEQFSQIEYRIGE